MDRMTKGASREVEFPRTLDVTGGTDAQKIFTYLEQLHRDFRGKSTLVDGERTWVDRSIRAEEKKDGTVILYVHENKTKGAARQLLGAQARRNKRTQVAKLIRDAAERAVKDKGLKSNTLAAGALRRIREATADKGHELYVEKLRKPFETILKQGHIQQPSSPPVSPGDDNLPRDAARLAEKTKPAKSKRPKVPRLRFKKIASRLPVRKRTPSAVFQRPNVPRLDLSKLRSADYDQVPGGDGSRFAGTPGGPEAGSMKRTGEAPAMASAWEERPLTPRTQASVDAFPRADSSAEAGPKAVSKASGIQKASGPPGHDQPPDPSSATVASATPRLSAWKSICAFFGSFIDRIAGIFTRKA